MCVVASVENQDFSDEIIFQEKKKIKCELCSGYKLTDNFLC